MEGAIREWGEVFRQLPRVDALFVPGGDPGHTEPKYLMGLLERQTANLRKYHPGATMWLSPQGFSSTWMDEFFGLMDRHPAWLTGIVFGPQVRMNLPDGLLEVNAPLTAEEKQEQSYRTKKQR